MSTKHQRKGTTVINKEHSSKAPYSTGLFALLVAFLCIAGSGASAALPASASAYATLEGPPQFSAAPGLPDGRIYEQVSPTDTNGNEAGATTTSEPTGAENRYGLAAPDGDAMLFEGTGPMGESPWGASEWFVASKQQGAAGWSTRALLPRAQQSIAEVGGLLKAKAATVDPSADLSHAMFIPGGSGTYALGMPSRCSSIAGAGQLYLAGPDPFVSATWLPRPTVETNATCEQPMELVGGTPDFSTVYFTYAGTLLPADASRAPYTGSGDAAALDAWGFYEDAEGTLRAAGTLPDGSPSPFGAVPAASGRLRAIAGNQVSADGSRAFFVSPDPAAVGLCKTAEEGRGDSMAQAASACAPQLYVRENGAGTLVSQDTLLPAAGGLPAAAPDGASRMPNGTLYNPGESYVFASPDGSQAFFQSEDRLTVEAPEGPPGDTSAKTYDFDVDTDALTYLPNVVGQIVATSEDGSSLAFVRPAAGSAPAELELWSAGPDGGLVTPITQLPGGEGALPVRISSDGSIVVFSASSLPAFNDANAREIFRYDVTTNTLGCVSCAPAGVEAASASMSALEANEAAHIYQPHGVVDERGISANGDRIFFETRAPLVSQDTNTDAPELPIVEGGAITEKQGVDVYEWENGVVYLVSGGKSLRNSFLLDNSANGDDVFFATTEALTPGHTDGAYAVYDARVPHPGDTPPATAVPCTGSVCQGPPNVPSPLTPPASATFSGLGNPTPEVAATTTVTKKTTTKTVKCKKNYVKKNNKCVKAKSKKKKAKKASTDRRTKS